MARKDNYNIERFHDYKLYIPTRTVYIGSESIDQDGGETGTDFAMTERVIKNLIILEHLSKDPITIIMNNVGGDTNSGLAIYDAIRDCESAITIKVYGNSSSMGSIILQAADERVMSPMAVQMIHYGHISVTAHSLTTYKHTAEAKRLDSWMEKMYLEKIKEKHPEFTLSRLQRMLNHDTFLTAQQSVELGLADKVLGEK